MHDSGRKPGRGSSASSSPQDAQFYGYARRAGRGIVAQVKYPICPIPPEAGIVLAAGVREAP